MLSYGATRPQWFNPYFHDFNVPHRENCNEHVAGLVVNYGISNTIVLEIP